MKTLKRLLEDETFMIREAAKRLTGVSLLANSSDKRLLVAHHLQDFFAALPLPFRCHLISIPRQEKACGGRR